MTLSVLVKMAKLLFLLIAVVLALVSFVSVLGGNGKICILILYSID